jgi:hypothetical protein
MFVPPARVWGSAARESSRSTVRAIEAHQPEFALHEPGLMAHHCELAGMTEREVEYLYAAGLASTRIVAIPEALSYFDRADAAIGRLEPLAERQAQHRNHPRHDGSRPLRDPAARDLPADQAHRLLDGPVLPGLFGEALEPALDSKLDVPASQLGRGWRKSSAPEPARRRYACPLAAARRLGLRR